MTTFGCDGGHDWECTVSNKGEVSMTDPYSSQFARNYGFTVALATSNSSVPVVTVLLVTMSIATSFFVRGPYTPDAVSNGNAAAQFCRKCHAEQSNEMHGVMNVPTTRISRL